METQPKVSSHRQDGSEEMMRNITSNSKPPIDYNRWGAIVLQKKDNKEIRRRDREDAVPFRDTNEAILSRILGLSHAVIGDGDVRVAFYGVDLCTVITNTPEGKFNIATYTSLATLEEGKMVQQVVGNYLLIASVNNRLLDVSLYHFDPTSLYVPTEWLWRATIGEEYGAGYEI